MDGDCDKARFRVQKGCCEREDNSLHSPQMNVQRSALAFAHSYGIELETIVNINQWLYELVYIVSIYS